MAGGTQAYTSEAFDQYGNSLGDTTWATIFSVEVSAGGSWSSNVYTSEKAGTWTVTGDYNGQAVTATLTVTAASPAMTRHFCESEPGIPGADHECRHSWY